MLFLSLIFKSIIFCALGILLRGTLARYRFDQLLQLSWKYFFFIWLGFCVLNISFVSFFNFFII